MKQKNGQFLFCSHVLNELVFWIRLPAFLSWIAVSCGIIAASTISLSAIKTGLSSTLLYIIMYSTAIISLSTGILIRSGLIRFVAFFSGALLLCLIRDLEQQKVSQLLTHPKSTIHNESSMTGMVISPPIFKNGYYKFLLKCSSASFDKDRILHSKVFQCKSPVIPPSFGKITAYGPTSQPAKPEKPYEFDEFTYLMANGITGKLTIDSMHVVSSALSVTNKLALFFRERVLTVLDRLKNPSHKSILLAAFLGEKEYLEGDIKTIFRRAGIYHLLAISGLHAGMLITASYLLLILLPCGVTTKHLITILILWSYQMFIGFIPSLFRATIMASVVIISLLFQRKNYALQSVGIAGTSWLLLSPKSLFCPGYQLSFSATTGIILLLPLFKLVHVHCPSSICRYVLSKLLPGFYVSLAGFLATLPVLLYHFGTVSVAGLFVNVAAVPVMTFCMWSFFLNLMTESLLPLLPELTATFSAFMLDVLIWIASKAATLSWSEFSSSTPNAVVIFTYSLFIVGVTAVNKIYLRTYLKWSLPALLLSIPAITLASMRHHTIEIERFTGKTATALAVKSTNNRVVLFYDGNSSTLESMLANPVKTWIRGVPGGTLEKIFILNRDTRSFTQFNHPLSRPGSTTVLTRLKTTLRTVLFSPKTHSSIIINNSKIRIETKTIWAEYTLPDTSIIYGYKSQNDILVQPFPCTISDRTGVSPQKMASKKTAR